MAVLSDSIEAFLLSLWNGEESPLILVQRNELANYFRCAPSQINYVLSTRFTLERGYTVRIAPRLAAVISASFGWILIKTPICVSFWKKISATS